jgi:hypothetical protein
MEYYIVRRGGHPYHASFLKSPNIKGWPDDKDFGSFRNAHHFENPNDAHKFVREHDGDFQGSVIRTDGTDLYEIEDDSRIMPRSKR